MYVCKKIFLKYMILKQCIISVKWYTLTDIGIIQYNKHVMFYFLGNIFYKH